MKNNSLLLTLILALSLTAVGFWGVSRSDRPLPQDAGYVEDAAYADPLEPVIAKFDAYPADTVVMTVNGQDMTWDRYYYVLGNYLSSLVYSAGSLPESFDMDVGGMTMDEYIRLTAESYLCFLGGMDTEYAGRFTDADSAAIEEQLTEEWAFLCEQYGGEETLLAMMHDNCMTRESFRYFSANQLRAAALREALYGELTDEQLTAWTDSRGLVRVKHILRLTNAEDLTEDGKAAILAEMETYLQDLQAAADDPEELCARFDTLMNEVSEDTGLMVYPDGYVFGAGEMVQEFETAAFALGEYELSGVVETSYGYHILLRLPMESGIIADIDSSSYESVELQDLAAEDLFMEDAYHWQNEAEVKLSPEFENFTLQSLFH